MLERVWSRGEASSIAGRCWYSHVVEQQVFLNAKKSLQIPIYKFIEGLNKR